jgi:hypothetical protein
MSVILARSTKAMPYLPRLLFVRAAHGSPTAKYILRRITGSARQRVVCADSRGTVYSIRGA